MNPTARARMRRVFPGSDVPDWLRYSEKQRQSFAEIAMIMARGNGATEDDTAFREFGYTGAADYWVDRLSEPMKASDFINLLIKHLRSINESGPGPAALFEKAFDLAQDMGERWFFDGPRHKALMVKPLDAAKWLSSLPRQQHLVPKTLLDMIQGNEPLQVPTEVLPIKRAAKPRGRRPDLSNQVVAAMRAMIVEGALSREALDGKTEKELEAMFGASRDTVRKARDLVLSENVENGNSDISSTNDK